MKQDNLALIEQSKYDEIWSRTEYRKISPGMMEAERAFLMMGAEPGMTLIDWGSGPARATKWFLDKGIDAKGVDFSEKASEYSQSEVPIIQACLWDLPDEIKPVDLSFCCDVLEHIPPFKVDQVLLNIRTNTKIAAYFRIATRPDKLGRLIGKPLHLTVQPGTWWIQKIVPLFTSLTTVRCDDKDVVVVGRV